MQKEIITHNNAVFLLQLYFAICFYLTVTISIHSQSAERKGKSQKKNSSQYFKKPKWHICPLFLRLT